MAIKVKILRADLLRQLCIQKNWFTCGNTEQYQKLMELGKIGDVQGVVYAIWMCSEKVTLKEVMDEVAYIYNSIM